MKLKIYTKEYKSLWDNFVLHSRNGTFLFYRDFIEYHGNRYRDYSLMFFDDEEKLIGLILGNIDEETYYSHQGLTYGGLIMGDMTTSAIVLEIFDLFISVLKGLGVREVVYKPVPHIYHKYPAEEDLYALFRNNAKLSARAISSTMPLTGEKISCSDSRKRGLKKAAKNKLVFEEMVDITPFWDVLQENMSSKYNVDPVHSLEEMKYLMKCFPDNIYSYQVKSPDNRLLAGCIMFRTDMVAHLQYVSSTEGGRGVGAVDLLINQVLRSCEQKKINYFDYGISTENGGLYLNGSLIYQKEGFGLRGIIYDKYVINLN